VLGVFVTVSDVDLVAIGGYSVSVEYIDMLGGWALFATSGSIGDHVDLSFTLAGQTNGGWLLTHPV